MSEKFQNIYRIEPNRCPYWDYSSYGSYFITICTSGRECFLGNIVNKKIKLSEQGFLVKDKLSVLVNPTKGLSLDYWTIMPNHIHLILTISNRSEKPSRKQRIKDFSKIIKETTLENITDYRVQRRRMTIPMAISKFKGLASKSINANYGTIGKKNWQADYHDHIIRDEKEYDKIKWYIINNPKNWTEDKFYIT